MTGSDWISFGPVCGVGALLLLIYMIMFSVRHTGGPR